MPGLFSRFFGRRETPPPEGPSPKWQPLYYPAGHIRPQPYPSSGSVELLGWPDDITTHGCLKHGLEAWLGMHAMRREGCVECLQCRQPSSSLILEFYSGWSDYREGVRYIGAFWWRWHTIEPDEARIVEWYDLSGQEVEGKFAYAEESPVMKSLHYRYVDGRILTRWGGVAQTEQGGSVNDQGAPVNPSGLATHSNLLLQEDLPEQSISPTLSPAVLMEWNPDEIRWGLALQLDSDKPEATRWAFSSPVTLPNRWLQLHP